jgi:hypothetical protein
VVQHTLVDAEQILGLGDLKALLVAAVLVTMMKQ